MTLKERFWSKVDRHGPDECWPWLAGGKPYGVFGYHAEGLRMQGAHRVAFRLTYGYWPNHACHNCNNKGCTNPAHIYDGNHKSNAQDASRAGTLNTPKCQGEVNAKAKLTAEIVREIRSSSEKPRFVAKRYGVLPNQIWRIRAGVAWRHVQCPHLE